VAHGWVELGPKSIVVELPQYVNDELAGMVIHNLTLESKWGGIPKVDAYYTWQGRNNLSPKKKL
jgi:hypothetical protein